MSSSSSSLRVFFFLLLLSMTSLAVLAQDDGFKPTYMTARLFVARLPKGQATPSDQVFRMRTPLAQAEDEKWLGNIKKVYPEVMDVALLRTQQMRMFMVPKPQIILIGDANQPHIEVHFLLAQGLRDDDTINTTAITEVNYYSGPKTSQPIPLSMGSNGFEVEPGNTYFFTTEGLKLRPDAYAVYFRDRSYGPSIQDYDHYLIVTVSVEPEKHTPWTFDLAKSLAMQSRAAKKVDVPWPDEVRKNRYFGQVQVRVEIGADGKVMQANIWQSTIPEGNLQVVATAKQWEFAPSELAGINPPASALLAFAILPPKAPEQKAPPATPEQNPSAQAKPTGTKTTATKPPVKRRNK